MPPDFDDYVSFQFRPNPGGRHGSYRSDTPESAPRVVVGERSSGVPAGRPARFYEPGRFARAKALLPFVHPMGNRQYRVKGSDEPEYFVDLNGDPMCYCADIANRGRRIDGRCKHVLACMLKEYYPPLVMAMADDIYARMERDEEK